MSSSETALELEKLRAEVAALRAAKEKSAPGPAEPDEVPAEATGPAGAESTSEGPTVDMRSQLHELTELLEAEIRDLPTITCLAVFTAGILLGRFLR